MIRCKKCRRFAGNVRRVMRVDPCIWFDYWTEKHILVDCKRCGVGVLGDYETYEDVEGTPIDSYDESGASVREAGLRAHMAAWRAEGAPDGSAPGSES